MSTTLIKSSLFPRKNALTTTQHVTYEDVHRIVITGTYLSPNDLQYLTKLIATETDEVKQSELKNGLPFLTVSVQYTEKSINKGGNQPFVHTGEVCLDFDHLTPSEMGRLSTAFTTDSFTRLLMTSSRGKGMKVFVTVNGITTANHDDVYNALIQHVKVKFDADADESCTPVTKGCYLRHDPTAFLNPHPAEYSATELLERYPITRKPVVATVWTLSPEELAGNREVVEDLVSQATNNAVVLASSYKDWVSLGFALKNTFGDEGFSYWNSFSQIDAPKYQGEESTRYKWDNALTGTSNKPLTFATIIHFANQAGLHPKKVKVAKVAPTANGAKSKNGVVSHDEIMNEWTKDYVLFYDSSTNTTYHAPANYTSIFELQPVSEKDDILNQWLVELSRKSLPIQRRKLEESIFNPMFRTPIDFMIEQMNFLEKQYDGVDYLSQLVSCVKTHDNTLFTTYFTKWAVNLVAGIYQRSIYDVNEYAIILTGGQGLKKSGFFAGLMWNQDYTANVHNFNPENKQHELLMTTMPLILIDEMTGYSKSDIGSLKSVMSKAKLSVDKKFKDNAVYKRIASFCGTTNEHDFLKDATGDRRFLTFEMLEELDYSVYNGINKQQLWGQIVSMYKSNFDYKFSQTEITETIQRNLEFTEHSHEDTFIEVAFELTGNPKDVVRVSDMRALEAEYKTIYKPPYFVTNTVKNKLVMQGVTCARTRVNGTLTRVYTGLKPRKEGWNNRLGDFTTPSVMAFPSTTKTPQR